MSSNLVWLPSLVGGLPAALGYCLCWYRLRRLERVAASLEEQVGAATARLGMVSDTSNGLEATLETLSQTVTHLEDRSTLDHQTGLRSGHLFAQDAAMLCRSSSAVAVFLIDLDVGRYTRQGQREAGEHALLSAAQALRDSLLREGDRLYRMPDAVAHFLVLLPVDHFAEAYGHAERLRTALERATIPASIGIAFADRTQEQRDPRRLLRLAATNSAAAKTKGLGVFPKLSDIPTVPGALPFEAAHLRKGPPPVAVDKDNETTAIHVGQVAHAASR